MTDHDADNKRQGLRRGQRQQVNYRETSSDDSHASTARDQEKAGGRTRKERLSSDYSDGQCGGLDMNVFMCPTQRFLPVPLQRRPLPETPRRRRIMWMRRSMSRGGE